MARGDAYHEKKKCLHVRREVSREPDRVVFRCERCGEQTEHATNQADPRLRHVGKLAARRKRTQLQTEEVRGCTIGGIEARWREEKLARAVDLVRRYGLTTAQLCERLGLPERTINRRLADEGLT